MQHCDLLSVQLNFGHETLALPHLVFVVWFSQCFHASSMALFLPNLSEVEEKHGITAIAIDEDKNSQLAVKWAVENFFNHKSRHFILVHVRIKTFNPRK
jgi:hypothetical protein